MLYVRILQVHEAIIRVSSQLDNFVASTCRRILDYLVPVLLKVSTVKGVWFYARRPTVGYVELEPAHISDSKGMIVHSHIAIVYQQKRIK